jgi:P27 family predicted phage terminase small subunit
MPLDDTRPPDWLSMEAKAEWRRVMPMLEKRRILTDADRGSLENYCCAIGTVREMERTLQAEGHVYTVKGIPKKHPAVAIRSDALTQARLLAAELGLTPVSRSRPKVREDPDAQDDLFGLGGAL